MCWCMCWHLTSGRMARSGCLCSSHSATHTPGMFGTPIIHFLWENTAPFRTVHISESIVRTRPHRGLAFTKSPSTFLILNFRGSLPIYPHSHNFQGLRVNSTRHASSLDFTNLKFQGWQEP